VRAACVFLADGAATYDPAVLTIEHVLPQTVADGSDWAISWPDEAKRASWLHRLANLVPLTQRRNSQAQNYDFDKKKNAYFGGRQGVSSYILTTQVLSTPVWTPSVVGQRQKDLLEVLSSKWDLKPAC
ncbi:MAG: HNH endonuclease, partial [Chloroflexia bacterium]|nr:HNH endonuclease [Chloroflexia bacterium]